MCVNLITMLKATLNIFISILLLQHLFVGAAPFSQPVDQPYASFQKPCDMDHCNPYMQKCPLCPTSNSTIPLFHQATIFYLPAISSSFISLHEDSLSDQGFVKAIFHPPTSNS